MGVATASCLAVEDSSNGLRAAAAAGMRLIAIPRPEYPPEADVLALPDLVLQSLAELTPRLSTAASHHGRYRALAADRRKPTKAAPPSAFDFSRSLPGTGCRTARRCGTQQRQVVGDQLIPLPRRPHPHRQAASLRPVGSSPVHCMSTMAWGVRRASTTRLLTSVSPMSSSLISALAGSAASPVSSLRLLRMSSASMVTRSPLVSGRFWVPISNTRTAWHCQARSGRCARCARWRSAAARSAPLKVSLEGGLGLG